MNTKFFATLLCMTSALTFSLAALADAGPLDGKTFVGKITQAGKKKGDKDKLVFKDGKVTSTECVQYGFKDGEYSAKVEGDTTTFEADIMGEEGAKMHWSGTITGDKLEATAMRTHGDEKPQKAMFAGKLATAEKKAKKAKTE